jgi:photosystem II oxygen-evolving enhancer protein 1
MKFFLLLIVLVSANAFSPTGRTSVSTVSMKQDGMNMKKFVAGALGAMFTLGSFNAPAHALLTKEQLNSLSYSQVKGTGLANRCPQTTGSDTISVNGKKKIVDFCVEPTIFQVEEEVAVKKGVPVKEFVKTKLMTRQTYSIDAVSGTMEVKDGKATFTEEDGIDYAATTVQMPGGERVPFLFSIKNLVAKGSGSTVKPGFEMGGPFTVPSYRTGLFLDPKGRGTTTGYDQAGALPALQTGEAESPLFKENNKVFDVLKGDVIFQVDAVNAAEGEFSGKFVSNQPGDTDMGGKDPKNILLKGIFYGRFE